MLSYLEGNTKYLLGVFDLYPKHKQEQVTWRLMVCKEDCVKNKECEYCGCPPEKKAFVTESCNKGDRFPDMMDAEAWKEYKVQHNIELDEEGI